MADTQHLPDLLPVLSRGKHRSPRRGACFMEYASVLAGERWSDHPACTHPLLGEVARSANDLTTDDGRRALAPLIPDVIGLTTDDPRADARIALHCAITALPVASDAQRSLAVGVLVCDRQLERLGDPESSPLRVRGRRTLEDVPDAARWAVAFTARPWMADDGPSPRRFRRCSAPGVVSVAAHGIAEAAVQSPDALLLELLVGSIAQVRELVAVPVRTAVIEDRRMRLRDLAT